MARGEKLLSATEVAKLKKPGSYSDGNGLILRISDTCSKNWKLRKTLNGKVVERGLGSFPEVSLALAREKAAEFRTLMVQGVDPRDEKRRRQTAEKAEADKMTFREVFEVWHKKNEQEWSNPKARAQVLARFHKYIPPNISQILISDLAVENIVNPLEKLWIAKPPTAKKLEANIQAALIWAWRNEKRETKLDVRKRDLGINASHYIEENHPELPYKHVSAFIRWLHTTHFASPNTRLLIEFSILTAVRPSEAAGAEWDEIDWEDRVWIVPRLRMKKRIEFQVPLSSRAFKIIEQLHAGTKNQAGLIFPGQRPKRPISETTVRKLLARFISEFDGHDSKITRHGFRAAFRTWAGEDAMFPREVAEMALAHQLKDKIERVYNRSNYLDQRRLLMQRWCDFICGNVDG